MSILEILRYTCDHCKKTADVESGEIPEGWRLNFNANFLEYPHGGGRDLCGACLEKFKKYLAAFFDQEQSLPRSEFIGETTVDAKAKPIGEDGYKYQKVKCLECDEQRWEYEIRCEKCAEKLGQQGKPVIGVDLAKPDCDKTVETEVKVCACGCGYVTSSNWPWCPNCGARLRQKKKSKII